MVCIKEDVGTVVVFALLPSAVTIPVYERMSNHPLIP